MWCKHMEKLELCPNQGGCWDHCRFVSMPFQHKSRDRASLLCWAGFIQSLWASCFFGLLAVPPRSAQGCDRRGDWLCSYIVPLLMSLLTWSVGDKEPCCWGRHSDSLQVVWLKSPLNVTVPLSPGASMLQHPDFPFVLEQSLLNICQLVRVTYLKWWKCFSRLLSAEVSVFSLFWVFRKGCHLEPVCFSCYYCIFRLSIPSSLLLFFLISKF